MDNERFLLEFTDLKTNTVLEADLTQFYYDVATATNNEPASDLWTIQTIRLEAYTA